jgi:hypothetical protein
VAEWRVRGGVCLMAGVLLLTQVHEVGTTAAFLVYREG